MLTLLLVAKPVQLTQLHYHPSLTVTHATIPAQTMTADNFLALIASKSAEGTIGDLIGGTDSFDVGATLHVGAAQVNGVYTGSFSVSVAYN